MCLCSPTTPFRAIFVSYYASVSDNTPDILTRALIRPTPISEGFALHERLAVHLTMEARGRASHMVNRPGSSE